MGTQRMQVWVGASPEPVDIANKSSSAAAAESPWWQQQQELEPSPNAGPRRLLHHRGDVPRSAPPRRPWPPGERGGRQASSNVLLTSSLRAKVGNFGFARWASGRVTPSSSSTASRRSAHHSDGLVAGNWAEFFSRAHHQRGHATVAAFSIGRRPPCSGQCRRPGRTRRGRRSAERGRRRRRRLRPGTSTLAPSQNPPPFSLQCVINSDI
uniref:Uncharacterized protein n=1 Tax=Oryza glumipatula TaxID=40148 RepID=A0A0E0A5M5_9ORYZ